MKNKKRKVITLIGVLAVCLAISVYVGVPTLETNEEGGVKFTMGEAIPSVYAVNGYDDCRITQLDIYDDTGSIILSYGGDGESQSADEGDVIDNIRCIIRVGDDYASSKTEAQNNSKITVTIENPSGTVVFNQEVDSVASVTDTTGYYIVRYYDSDLNETLENGTYNITTTYEIYA